MSQRIIVTAPGRLVADPDMPTNEKAPAVFRIACNTSVKVDGQWTEKATFMRVRDWNHDRVKKLAKGALVVVTGELTQDERPEDKGGGFYACEIKAMNVDVLLWGENKSAAEGGVASQGKKAAATARRSKEDLPF